MAWTSLVVVTCPVETIKMKGMQGHASESKYQSTTGRLLQNKLVSPGHFMEFGHAIGICIFSMTFLCHCYKRKGSASHKSSHSGVFKVTRHRNRSSQTKPWIEDKHEYLEFLL